MEVVMLLMTYLHRYVFQIKQNVEVFNMITKRYEAKTLIKNDLCNCKCKFNSTTCNWYM